MAIQLLPQVVQAILRSGTIITSPAQTIVELVLNSLDAGATSIAVRVDLKLFRLQVVDNGCGMGLEHLDAIGPRYMTSKCHTLEDLRSNIVHYGFRGEALSSLREVSGLLLLVSRPSGSNETYCKAFTHGKAQAAAVSNSKRPACGTTITVQDFMYNMPVRRKRIYEAIDLEEIRSHIACIALMHPQVSFSLRDDSKGSMILEKHKSADFLSCFSHIFGQTLAQSLAPIDYTSAKFKISGFISKEVHRQKHLQFIYVNKRVIVKTKLHRLVNALLAKSSILRANGPWRHRPIPKGVSADRWLAFPSPEKRNKFPVFLIHIECATKEYDVCLDPRKTLIEFEDWKTVLQCVEDAIRNFLEREHLVYDQEEIIPSSQESVNKTCNSSNKSNNHSEDTDMLNEERISENTKVLSNGSVGNNFNIDSANIDDETINVPHIVHGIAAKRGSKAKGIVSKCEDNTRNSLGAHNVQAVPTKCIMRDDCLNGTSLNIRINNVSETCKDDSNKFHNTQLLNHSSINEVGSPKSDCKSASTRGRAPPIVEFKEKYQQSSVSNLKITKGAYLYKLEEVKKKKVINVSKVLQKYDRSLIKSKIGQVSKSINRDKLNKTESMKSSEHCNLVLHNITSELQEDSLAQKEINKCDISNKLVSDTFNGMNDEYYPPTKSHSPMDDDLCTKMKENNTDIDEKNSDVVISVSLYQNSNIADSVPEKESISMNDFKTNFDKNISTATQKLDLLKNINDAHTYSLKCKNLVQLEETFSADRDDSSKSLLETSSNVTSPLSCQDERHFLTTEDFLCPIASDLAKNVYDSNWTQYTKSKNSVSNNLPVFEKQHSEISEFVKNDFEHSTSNSKERETDNLSRKSSDGSDFEVFPKPFLETSIYSYNLDSISSNIVCIGKQTKMLNNPKFDLECEKSPYLSVQPSTSYSSIKKPDNLLGKSTFEIKNEETSNLTVKSNLSNLGITKQASIFDSSTSDVEHEEIPNLILQSNQSYSRIRKQPDIFDSPTSDTENENLPRMTVQSDSCYSGGRKQATIFHSRIYDIKNEDISNVIPDPNTLCTNTRNLATIVEDPTSDSSYEEVQSLNIQLNTHNSNIRNWSKMLNNPAYDMENEKTPNLNVQSKTHYLRDIENKKTVSFSDNVSYFTTTAEKYYPFKSQDEYNTSSFINTQNSDTMSLEKDVLRNVKYQTLSKTLSISEMEMISIPSLSSPYFSKKSQIAEPETEILGSKPVNTGHSNDETINCSNNSGNEGSEQSDDSSILIDVPLTQPSPSQLRASESEDVGNAPLSRIDFGSPKQKDQAFHSKHAQLENENKSNVLDNKICESPYFSFKPCSSDSNKDFSQSQMEVENINFGRKRNSGNDFGEEYGKRASLEKKNVISNSINLSQLVVDDDNKNKKTSISNSISSQDLLDAYNSAVNNISTHQDTNVQCDLPNNLTHCNEVVNNIVQEEVHTKNNSSNNICYTENETSEEWTQMTNNHGKVFYVHVRSGITSYNPPLINHQSSYTMTKRYGFLPKGMSPILDDSVPNALKGSINMTPNSRQALHDVILNNTDLGDDSLATVKWKELPDPKTLGCKDLVKQLLITADNRMQHCEKPVPTTSKLAVKMSNSIYHCKYDKEIFSNIQIIGQWDNKFIMTVVSFEKVKRPHVIGVFDQHAVHERIRLEKLMEDYLEEGSDSCFHSSSIDPHIILDLSGKEYRIISSFKEKFERLGLYFNPLNEFSVKVTKVPTCLHARDLRERSKGSVLKNFLEILIQEHVEFLIKTRGNEPRVPNILREVINFEACRGAIKFGDSLSNEDCRALLTNLSKCQLPFYCAHGRPSFVPIFDMKQFEMQETNDQAVTVKQLLSTLQ